MFSFTFSKSHFIGVCVCLVDLISIDRRSPEQEAECLERARVLAEQFMEKVKDTDDHMWKPDGTNTETQSDRYRSLAFVFLWVCWSFCFSTHLSWENNVHSSLGQSNSGNHFVNWYLNVTWTWTLV